MKHTLTMRRALVGKEFMGKFRLAISRCRLFGLRKKLVLTHAAIQEHKSMQLFADEQCMNV